MTKPKYRLPDGRFGKTNNPGAKPSETYDWDAAIQRLKTILNNLDNEK